MCSLDRRMVVFHDIGLGDTTRSVGWRAVDLRIMGSGSGSKDGTRSVKRRVVAFRRIGSGEGSRMETGDSMTRSTIMSVVSASGSSDGDPVVEIGENSARVSVTAFDNGSKEPVRVRNTGELF